MEAAVSMGVGLEGVVFTAVDFTVAAFSEWASVSE
jgi:hypothetical protein